MTKVRDLRRRLHRQPLAKQLGTELGRAIERALANRGIGKPKELLRPWKARRNIRHTLAHLLVADAVESGQPVSFSKLDKEIAAAEKSIAQSQSQDDRIKTIATTFEIVQFEVPKLTEHLSDPLEAADHASRRNFVATAGIAMFTAWSGVVPPKILGIETANVEIREHLLTALMFALFYQALMFGVRSSARRHRANEIKKAIGSYLDPWRDLTGLIDDVGSAVKNHETGAQLKDATAEMRATVKTYTAAHNSGRTRGFAEFWLPWILGALGLAGCVVALAN